MSNIPHEWANGTAAQRLVSTIETTGGLIGHADSLCAPAADPDWIDLADAYLQACAELNRTPMITRQPEDEDA
jgi:hypothetical protein